MNKETKKLWIGVIIFMALVGGFGALLWWVILVGPRVPSKQQLKVYEQSVRIYPVYEYSLRADEDGCWRQAYVIEYANFQSTSTPESIAGFKECKVKWVEWCTSPVASLTYEQYQTCNRYKEELKK